MYQPIDITITDPRQHDGNPFEVAEYAIAQCEGILDAYTKALEAAFLMARNADMERNIALGMPPAGSGYATSPQGRRFEQLRKATEDATETLRVLKKAAAYDPSRRSSRA